MSPFKPNSSDPVYLFTASAFRELTACFYLSILVFLFFYVCECVSVCTCVSPCSESVNKKTSGCSGSSAIMAIRPTTHTLLLDVDLNWTEIRRYRINFLSHNYSECYFMPCVCVCVCSGLPVSLHMHKVLITLWVTHRTVVMSLVSLFNECYHLSAPLPLCHSTRCLLHSHTYTNTHTASYIIPTLSSELHAILHQNKHIYASLLNAREPIKIGDQLLYYCQ